MESKEYFVLIFLPIHECLATFYLSTTQNPCLCTVWVICSRFCTDPNGTLCVLFVRKNWVSRRSLCLKGQRNYSNDKGWCDCRWLWRHGAMSSSTASATRYTPVIYFSYTWYIPIQMSYTRYMLIYTNEKKYIPGIYLIYTMHKPFIRRPQIIHDIYRLKTFSDISVPVTLRYGHGIYQVYT